MKTFITSILIIFTFFTESSVEKSDTPYGYIISEADLIVEGEIVDLSENKYNFKINDFIKSESPNVIKVNIWEEWICDRRTKDLNKGERLILFLKEDDNGDFSVIAGSRGELFINKNDTVRIFSIEEPTVEKIKYGIKTFLNAFEYKKNETSESRKLIFKKKVGELEIKKNVEKNAFFKLIITEIHDYNEGIN